MIEAAQNTAVTRLKQDMALRAKAAELGLDQLTEEETAKAKEDAESSLETTKNYIKSFYLTEEQQQLEGEELEKAIQENSTGQYFSAPQVGVPSGEDNAGGPVSEESLQGMEFLLTDIMEKNASRREALKEEVLRLEEEAAAGR